MYFFTVFGLFANVKFKLKNRTFEKYNNKN